MIDKITFTAGPMVGSAPLVIEVGSLTIFVGPNNSGKSQALRDIEILLASNIPQKVISHVSIKNILPEEILDALRPMIRKLKNGNISISSLKQRVNTLFRFSDFEERIQNVSMARGFIYNHLTQRLDGEARLSLLNPVNSGDLLDPQTSELSNIFHNESLRKRIRALTYTAFQRYLVIDPTALGSLRVRMALRPPSDESEEQSWDARARAFHEAATPIGEFSDGVKAYTGLLVATMSSGARIILIDEPEAFLHPALARALGGQLAVIAKERTSNVITSTHSSEFLMGCVESGIDVQIVRLTYSDSKATARALSPDDLRLLMKDPLLRSTNMLNALFHTGVVVGESDADRAFYQEINYRLQSSQSGGAAGALFLHAQNKQTVPRIVGPLRKLGIPAAAIVDIDVLKDGGTEWTRFLEAGQVPSAMHSALAIQRKTLKDLFDKTGRDMKRDGGVKLLTSNDQEACRQLFEQLSQYGLFIIPHGELEAWLQSLGAKGHGANWLIDIFTKMGIDSSDPHYVKPEDGDVWNFIRKVGVWIANPNRLGVAP